MIIVSKRRNPKIVELKGGDLEMCGKNYYSNLPGTEPRGYIFSKPIVPRPNLKNLSGGLNLSRGLNMVGST